MNRRELIKRVIGVAAVSHSPSSFIEEAEELGGEIELKNVTFGEGLAADETWYEVVVPENRMTNPELISEEIYNYLLPDELPSLLKAHRSWKNNATIFRFCDVCKNYDFYDKVTSYGEHRYLMICDDCYFNLDTVVERIRERIAVKN